MTDIRLDELTNDILISGGKLSIISDNARAVRQRLLIRLRTFKGEWFLDSAVGVPYFQSILRQGVRKELVDVLLKRTILETEGVQRITSYSSTLNRQLRTYSASFSVTTLQGDSLLLEI